MDVSFDKTKRKVICVEANQERPMYNNGLLIYERLYTWWFKRKPLNLTSQLHKIFNEIFNNLSLARIQQYTYSTTVIIKHPIINLRNEKVTKISK